MGSICPSGSQPTNNYRSSKRLDKPLMHASEPESTEQEGEEGGFGPFNLSRHNTQVIDLNPDDLDHKGSNTTEKKKINVEDFQFHKVES